MNSVTIGSKLLIIKEQKFATDNIEDLVTNLGTNNKSVQISEYMEFLDSYIPDVIITDISINTDSLIEISRFLKSSTQYSDIPIVAVIKNSDHDEVETVLNAGADDFIYSPVNLIELRSRLSNQFYIVKYRRKWKKELQQLEILNKEKNEILAIAAHDLKNPIFSIQLLGKTIRDDITLTKDELYEFSNDIVASCDRIMDIIKQLLDLNSIESGKIILDIKPQYVLESVRHFIELYKHKASNKNIAVNLEYSSDGMAKTDLVSFNNIFDNFISNAIKYSPYNKSIFIKMYDDNDKLVVSVSDRGPGIPQSEQDKLFTRFAKISNQPTGGENSTGLGLSIVKKFSELINAEIKFENNSNSEGATFSVILPKY